jgi:hypothetical protein
MATVNDISTGWVWAPTRRGRNINNAAAHTIRRLCIPECYYRPQEAQKAEMIVYFPA